MASITSKLFEEIEQLRVIDTHEHTYPPEIILKKGPSIVDILEGSYFFWIAKPLKDREDYSELIERIREVMGSAFFKACSIAIKELHGVSIDPPSIENLKEASERVREAYRNRDWIKTGFRDKALIDKAIWDPHWNILGDSFDPSLFIPVFRIDPFLIGYSRKVRDHDGNTPYIFEKRMGVSVESFEDYLTLIDKVLEEARRKCIAIKCASAYERSISFEFVDEKTAKKVFEKGEEAKPAEAKLFGDFVLNYILEKNREIGFPVQFHTGLAQVEGSNPMNLVNIIRKYSDVNFILFHGGYPWIRQFAILGFTFPNVYLDLCWLPMISPSSCAVLLKELIELGLSSKIMWGGDCWVVEGTYGALKLFKQILARALGDLVDRRYLTSEEAIEIASKILRENPARIFKFQS
ncbi:MAG: amidohydrolase family protein [Thaumarchaeota archaeon]|nr:amidohydrolase family protein [Nitrososphaerota archaeon]